jgi:hypothetical protein
MIHLPVARGSPQSRFIDTTNEGSDETAAALISEP